MAEWPNAVVLKTIEPKGSGGSNPSLSAIFPYLMKTVAIIEDQTAIREMMSQAILNREEFEVILECGDGKIGLEQTLELKPDFVILDVMLPNLNGTEILRNIASQLPDARVLIFSGYQSPGWFANCSSGSTRFC